MGIFKRKQGIRFDPETQEPVVRRSICTGEMTVGLLDRRSGRFSELMLVRNQQELKDVCRQLGVADIRTIY
ncbi:MAG: aspartate dehydrogenase [Oscillospiraceae bacterium]|nr:aspartate dehydrogenase [Oscillospiraceae bacterium]